MSNVIGKSDEAIRAGLRLAKLYIAVAFLIWRWSYLRIVGDGGVFLNFTASPMSLAVGGGYVICVIILLGHALAQLKSKQHRGVISSLLFAGLGLLFLAMGSGLRNRTVTFFEVLVSLGLGGLTLYFLVKGRRQFKNPAFICWIWGYSINLIWGVGMKCYSAGKHPSLASSGFPGRSWSLVQKFGGQGLLGNWLWESYWLGYAVANALILTGLVLLVREARGNITRSSSANAIKYLTVFSLLLFAGIYPSLVLFNSPTLVTAWIANVVMLVYLVSANRRTRSLCFTCWAWACGLSLSLAMVGQFHRPWFNAPHAFAPTSSEIVALGGLMAGILWVAGLVLAVRQLALEKRPPADPWVKTMVKHVLSLRLEGGPGKYLPVIIGTGVVIIVTALFSVEDPAEFFSFEPKYDGHRLSYWAAHPRWNQLQGRDPESEMAIKAIGPKAVPYLVAWVGEPMTSYPRLNYPGWGLYGFQVLGPAAKSAVPGLIKIIGRGNYPESALEFIGPDAVPALADKYLETLADTNPPTYNWRNWHYSTLPSHVQECVLQTLAQMGTNAEASIPALIKGANTKRPWTQGGAAIALGSVGQNKPDIVIPVLINVFTNSSADAKAAVWALGSVGKNRPDAVIPVLIGALANTNLDFAGEGAIAQALATAGQGRPQVVIPALIQALARMNAAAMLPTTNRNTPFYPYASYSIISMLPYNFSEDGRGMVADALATFGNNARGALPALMAAAQSKNAEVRSHAAVAIQDIAPEIPDALAPLIRNLGEKDAQIRRQALSTLASLGANALEALPAVTKICRSDPDLEVREGAIDCISKIGKVDDDVLQALSENLTGNNSSLDYEAFYALSKFSDHSQAAFIALMRAWRVCPDRGTRDQIRYYFQSAVQRDASILTECLTGSDTEVRYEALQVVDRLRTDLPETGRALQQALHDKNPEARLFATNMAIEIDTAQFGRPVAELLVHGADLNATNDQGQTILHLQMLSAGPNQMAAIKALLEAGANPNARDNLGRTPAHLLLLGKWPWEKAGEILALLVDKGANLSLPDRNGQTPLHYFAALGGQSPLFFIRDSGNIFLRTKADFQARDSDGNTPLHVAIKSGTWDVYDWLREHGASLDVTNNAGLTPRRLVMDSGDPFAWSKMNADTDIYWAIREDKLEAVIAIVKAEPGVVNKFNLFGETPMKEAVQLRRTNIVEFLDQHGGEWDCFSAITMGRTDVLSHLISQQPWTVTDRYDGETLLHLVAANGNVAAVDVLVKAGADLQAINSFGLSPLGEALECRHDEVAELLVKHGAAKNIFDAAVAGDGEAVAGLIAKDRSLLSSVNAQGVSVAEIAAAADNVKTLRLLLDQGVSPDFRDQRLGKSLLHIAAAYNRPENVKLLIARGANVDVFDNLGFTPLHVAALWNSTEVLELLLQHKAQCNVLATAPKAILPAAPFRPGSAVADVEGSTPLHLAALNAQTNAIVLLLKWGAAINATDSSGMTALDLAGQAGPPQFELMHSTGVGMPFPPPDPMRDNLDVRRKTAVALLEQVGGKHGEN